MMTHVRATLERYVIQEFHCWTDSTMVLYLSQGQGTWSQFVRNRTKVIKENGFLNWRYVPTKETPSDLCSRGVQPSKLGDLWFHGPQCPANPEKWPQQPDVLETKETSQERVTPKKEKGLQTTEVPPEANLATTLLERYSSY